MCVCVCGSKTNRLTDHKRQRHSSGCDYLLASDNYNIYAGEHINRQAMIVPDEIWITYWAKLIPVSERNFQRTAYFYAV